MPQALTKRRTNPAVAALVICALVGIGLVLLYPDSYQQDGGTHFWFARWAWRYPRFFVDVWARPVFTLLYSVPALAGYRVAKLTTVAICVATAWQTWRLAQDHDLDRAPLVVAFLWLEPSFLLLSSETMTEPLFALLLVLALRLHRRGRVGTGALLMSLASLARPEGFILAPLWAIWLLGDKRAGWAWWLRLRMVALLAVGPLIWWFAAFVITGDVLYPLHNWPANWSASTATYGRGSVLDYFYRRGEIVGPLLQVPFAVGVLATLVRRRLTLELAVVVWFFVAHSLLRALGAFGSAGYPRYFVCIAPALALLTLLGWDVLANLVRSFSGRVGRPLVAVAAAVVVAISGLCAIGYVDAMPWSRDARLVDAAYDWFRAHPEPVSHLYASQAYGCIRFGCDPAQRALPQGDASAALGAIRALPPHTLILWDADTGPSFYGGLTGDEIAAAGYTPIWTRADTLYGSILPHLANGRYLPKVMSWGWGTPRAQHMWLLYR